MKKKNKTLIKDIVCALILIVFIIAIVFMLGCSTKVNAERNEEENFAVVEKNNMNGFTIYVVKDTKYGNEYIVSKCREGIGITPRYEKATVTHDVRNLIAN